ncbi:hypothetical protein TJA_19360 [Thermus sp. LT1-2-5]|uniref:hypothetical protein n=1 Tax=Thermus sp. LT1-2-5 TaxID=3026935 RepID=UPI0030E9D97F
MREAEWAEALFHLRRRGFVRQDGDGEERRAFALLERHQAEVRAHLEAEGILLWALPPEEPMVFVLVPSPSYEEFLRSSNRATLRERAEARLKAYLFLKHLLLGTSWADVGPGFRFHPRADQVRHLLLLSGDRSQYEAFLRAEKYLEGDGDEDLLKAWDKLLEDLTDWGLLRREGGEVYALSSLALLYEEVLARAGKEA